MKGQVSASQIIPLVVVPIAVILMLLIFSNVDKAIKSQDILMTTAVNETLGSLDGTSPTTLNTHNRFVDFDSIVVYKINATSGVSSNIPRNGTASCTSTSANCFDVRTEDSQADGLDTAEITVYATDSSTGYTIKSTYDYVGNSAGQTVVKVADMSYRGFDLAGILPLVIAGVTIIGVLMGAFVFLRR